MSEGFGEPSNCNRKIEAEGLKKREEWMVRGGGTGEYAVEKTSETHIIQLYNGESTFVLILRTLLHRSIRDGEGRGEEDEGWRVVEDK